MTIRFVVEFHSRLIRVPWTSSRDSICRLCWRFSLATRSLTPRLPLMENGDYPITHPEGLGNKAKSLGAFYTDAGVADFLAWWAIRSANDKILDPCFGGGIFLRAACQRLAELEGSPRTQVFGIEIDPLVYHCIKTRIA